MPWRAECGDRTAHLLTLDYWLGQLNNHYIGPLHMAVAVPDDNGGYSFVYNDHGGVENVYLTVHHSHEPVRHGVVVCFKDKSHYIHPLEMPSPLQHVAVGPYNMLLLGCKVLELLHEHFNFEAPVRIFMPNHPTIKWDELYQETRAVQIRKEHFTDQITQKVAWFHGIDDTDDSGIKNHSWYDDERLIAVIQGNHSRLGEGSLLKDIDGLTLRLISRFSGCLDIGGLNQTNPT